jgi:hypothetical protein
MLVFVLLILLKIWGGDIFHVILIELLAKNKTYNI